MNPNKELNPLTYLVLEQIPEQKSNLGGTTDSAGDILIDNIDYVAGKTKQGKDMQTSYDEAKKNFWVGDAADYAKEYANTPQGRETLNWLGGLAAPLFGKQSIPDISNTGNAVNAKAKNKGLSPTLIVIISMASVVVLGGIGFAIYKYTK